jgi:hypothetical protein
MVEEMNILEQKLLAQYKNRPNTVKLFAPANYQVGGEIEGREIIGFGYSNLEGNVYIRLKGGKKYGNIMLYFRGFASLDHSLKTVEAVNGIKYFKRKDGIVYVQESAFYDNQIVSTAHWYDTFSVGTNKLYQENGVYDLGDESIQWQKLNSINKRLWKFLPFQQ